MKKIILLFLVFGNMAWVLAQEISGNVFTEEGIPLEKTLVINLKTNEKVYTDNDGLFHISANGGDEIRVIKDTYDRISHLVKASDFGQKLTFKMHKTPKNIQEVVITKVSKEKIKDLKNSIGLPEPLKTKPYVPTAKSVLLPALLGTLNINGLKDLVSGDARRKRTLYQYEGFQENVDWIKDRVDTAYFVEKGVPEERLSEFIGFVITERPMVKQHIKKREVRQIEKIMEGVLPTYVNRIKTQK